MNLFHEKLIYSGNADNTLVSEQEKLKNMAFTGQDNVLFKALPNCLAGHSRCHAFCLCPSNYNSNAGLSAGIAKN